MLEPVILLVDKNAREGFFTRVNLERDDQRASTLVMAKSHHQCTI
jgi:hypothetical protein